MSVVGDGIDLMTKVFFRLICTCFFVALTVGVRDRKYQMVHMTTTSSESSPFDMWLGWRSDFSAVGAVHRDEGGRTALVGGVRHTEDVEE